MSVVSNKIALESFEEVQEYYHSRGWTDGFPIVPPTLEAVQACLDWAYMRNDELIGIEPGRERPITAAYIQNVICAFDKLILCNLELR